MYHKDQRGSEIERTPSEHLLCTAYKMKQDEWEMLLDGETGYVAMKWSSSLLSCWDTNWQGLNLQRERERAMYTAYDK